MQKGHCNDMEVRDVFGHVIHEYDVCKAMATGEVMLVIKGSDGKLIVRNNIIGLSDYLDVYPDGELKILGNASTSS
ncbi:hypothetical protein [Ligilactobacillus animalis]